MLPLDDPRWQHYSGGYRMPYDASRPLRRLLDREPPEPLFDELWQELHHQGDVDAASYAATPYLLTYAQQSTTLNWSIFALISTIELARPNNPPPPPELTEAYFRAIHHIPAVVGQHPQQQWDDLLTQSIVSCIALARGQRVFARAYLEFHFDAARAWLRDAVGGDFEVGDERT